MNITFSNRVNGRALAILARWCQHTCRLTITGFEHVLALRQQGTPILWTTWHGQTMMMLGFMLQRLHGIRLNVMIPDDWRGETLYHMSKLLDVNPVPMDLTHSNSMATARKFLSLARELKKGEYDNFIAPDGPGGPGYQVKPGLGFLAQHTGLPVLPLAGHNRYGYSINRWDAYRLPIPFSRFHITIEPPFTVGRKDDRDAVNERIRRTLNDVTLRAKAEYYENS